MAKDSDQDDLIIVGIGASAGGLEAISSLLTSLPQDMDAAYVIAQHMSPTHNSLLAVLIARETNLNVIELNEEPRLPEADTIYVTPPNTDVVLKNRQLQLVEPSGHPAVPKPSADRLLNSIADEYGSKSVGIILSGTGADGSYGIRAIRKEGGITIAQEPCSAKYEGMPQSAIETGCVDLVLAPSEIGSQFRRILRQPEGFSPPTKDPVPNDDYAELIKLLRINTRLDFSDYKENTILRRIQRRMVALNIGTFEQYVARARESRDEVHALQRDLLISVTRFFRDANQFGQLEREIRRLVFRKDKERIRLWVVGCATGEEVYSIAILVAEAFGGIDALDSNQVQIFATDVDEDALHVARKGLYPPAALQDIPQDLASTYFRTKTSGVEVIPEIRAITLFSKHNVITDPPFMKVDLVSLRNVMIYFKQELQTRVLTRMHYTLQPDGLLFLGTSEALGEMDAFFQQLPSCDKVFKSRTSARPYQLSLADPEHLRAPPSLSSPNRQQTQPMVDAEQDQQMFLALARTVAPNGFIAQRNHDIIRVFGDMTPFMELNEMSNLRMSTRILRKVLRDEVPSLMTLAFKAKASREGRWHRIEGYDFNQARLICFPVIAPSGEDQILVAVQTRMDNESAVPVESLSDKERTQYILEIETEMQSTREALQQTVEELQTSNEALQSVNEELQSTNEELQATNEELETSNEELQSTNEELITVNEEMQISASELDLVTTELKAVLAASPYPLLVLDQTLVVRQASDSGLRFLSMEELPMNGLHLSQCNLPADFPSLLSTADETLLDRGSRSVRFDVGRKVFTVAFTPFADAQSSQLGLTITFYDTDQQVTEKLTETMERMGNVGFWSYDPDSSLVSCSDSVASALGLTEHKCDLADVVTYLHPNDREVAIDTVRDAYVKGQSFTLTTRAIGQNQRIQHVEISGTPVHNSAGRIMSFVGACQDISNQLLQTLAEDAFEHMQSSTGLRVFSYDTQNDELFMAGDPTTLARANEGRAPLMTRKAFVETMQRDSRKAVRKGFDTLITKGGTLDLTVKLAGSRGTKAEYRLEMRARKVADGIVSHVYGTMQPTA